MKSGLVKVAASLIATAPLLASWGTANAAPYVLVAWHQRTATAMSSLFFKSGAAQGCPTVAPFKQPCYNPANAWVSGSGAATAIQTAGQSTWDWDGTTLTQTGMLWATSFISSNANGTAVIGDKITNLVITPNTATSTAATYECTEGNFLSTVNANGCLSVDLGGNAILESSAAYNVGGNANCINRTVGGDDFSTGTHRSVSTAVAGGGCDAVDGGFDLHTVVPNPRFLILANQASILGPDGCYMFGRASEKSTNPCAAGPLVSNASYMIFAPAVDTDGDGVVDALDNCRLHANATQVDSDADGFGNRCDGDLGPGTGNGFTNAQDNTLFKAQLGQPSVPPTYNKADINANGFVNAQDNTLFKALLGSPPGPSGLCNADRKSVV